MAARRPPSSPERFLESPAPRVLAHRGLALDAPENTLLSFARAVALGVEIVETDVHVSHDGVAVIAHDADLQRVAGRNVRVDQLSMAELRRVSLGHGQGFCSLADALDAFPDTRFNIDVKIGGAVAPTAAAVLEAGATPRVLLTSFDEKRRAQAVAAVPGVATSASSRRMAQALSGVTLRNGALVRRALAGMDAIQVPEKYGAVTVVTDRMITAAHALGVEVHVWTVNEPETMRRLLALGVDGIVTDRADLALGVLREV